MTTLFARKRASSMALAIALATGTALVATAAFPTEASAQRNRDSDSNEADGGGYGDEFRSVYGELEEPVLQSQDADLTPLVGRLQQLRGLISTTDEKFAGGNVLFLAGRRIGDDSMALFGIENMLETGRVPITATAQYNFIAYQLSNRAGDYPKARGYLQNAINFNFTNPNVTPAVLQMLMAENHFSNEEYAAGIGFLETAIQRQKASAQPVDETWYKRGFAIAYNNSLQDKMLNIALDWVSDYPGEDSWRDTINATRNFKDYEGGELLDLLRLSRKVGVLRGADFDYYAETADARRLPKEVSDVINAGMQSGDVTADNLFLNEQLQIATGRIAADRADLPQLESDANAADASVRLLAAAGDTFLSYGEYTKAAGFYERALAMPGVDTNEELTRLGIAQIGAEQFDAARETLGKVTGNRTTIARLWLAYIDEQQVDDSPSLQDLFS